MCGRFTLFISSDELSAYFRLDSTVDFTPRYNIAPTQTVPCIVQDESGKRAIRLFRWGLIPQWAKDAKIGSRLINARAETVESKPSFRSAFKHHRCLIPTTGFFEWKRDGNRKHPYLIGMSDGEPFAFAGIWEQWTDPEGQVIRTCAILTTTSNELVGEIHDRMPVILASADYDCWLASYTSVGSLQTLLMPYPAELMVTHEATNLVNNPQCDAPECIKAAD